MDVTPRRLRNSPPKVADNDTALQTVGTEAYFRAAGRRLKHKQKGMASQSTNAAMHDRIKAKGRESSEPTGGRIRPGVDGHRTGEVKRLAIAAAGTAANGGVQGDFDGTGDTTAGSTSSVGQALNPRFAAILARIQAKRKPEAAFETDEGVRNVRQRASAGV